MAQVAVSVVLPYRDAAATIEVAVRSILAQRDVTLECIAVDDGSRDDGPRIVGELAAGDPRLVPCASEGVGIARAVDRGIRSARAAWIARMDADDESLPTRLARQLDTVLQHPDTDVCGTWVEPFATSPDVVGGGMTRYCAWLDSLVTPEEHLRERFVESPVCHPTVLVRRDALERAGGYRDVPWPEDYDVWLRMLEGGARFRKTPERLYRWRIHAGQATRTDARYAPPAFRALKATYLARALRSSNAPVVVWGAGPIGRRLARELRPHGVAVRSFVDIDPRKIDRARQGVPVIAPERLRKGDQTIVVAVGVLGARAQIRAWLDERGFREGDHYLCAA